MTDEERRLRNNEAARRYRQKPTVRERLKRYYKKYAAQLYVKEARARRERERRQAGAVREYEKMRSRRRRQDPQYCAEQKLRIRQWEKTENGKRYLAVHTVKASYRLFGIDAPASLIETAVLVAQLRKEVREHQRTQ